MKIPTQVRHHKAFWIIPSDRIFNSHQTTFIDSLSCILFLWQLHLSLNIVMCYFMLKYLICSQEMFSSAPINNVDVKTFGRKWFQNVKQTSWGDAWEMSYTTWYKIIFPGTGQLRGNSHWVCKKSLLLIIKHSKYCWTSYSAKPFIALLIKLCMSCLPSAKISHGF